MFIYLCNKPNKKNIFMKLMKLLFILLTLLFVACSNEEEMLDVQKPQIQLSKLDIKPQIRNQAL